MIQCTQRFIPGDINRSNSHQKRTNRHEIDAFERWSETRLKCMQCQMSVWELTLRGERSPLYPWHNNAISESTTIKFIEFFVCMCCDWVVFLERMFWKHEGIGQIWLIDLITEMWDWLANIFKVTNGFQMSRKFRRMVYLMFLLIFWFVLVYFA